MQLAAINEKDTARLKGSYAAEWNAYPQKAGKNMDTKPQN